MTEPSDPGSEQVPPTYFENEKFTYNIPQVIRSMQEHKKRLDKEIESIDLQIKMLEVIYGKSGQGPCHIQKKGIVAVLSSVAVSCSRVTGIDSSLYLQGFSNNGGHTDLESFSKAYFKSPAWKQEIISKEISNTYKIKWGKILCLGEIDEELKKYHSI
jgi:hypothetical protein